MENTHIKNEESTSVTSNSETAAVAASSTDNNTMTGVTSSGQSDNNNGKYCSEKEKIIDLGLVLLTA
jgi:hypothetical protein